MLFFHPVFGITETDKEQVQDILGQYQILQVWNPQESQKAKENTYESQHSATYIAPKKKQTLCWENSTKKTNIRKSN